MPLERLLLVNKPIAENSETLVNPQSQESLSRILIVLVAAQQPLEDLFERSILISLSTSSSFPGFIKFPPISLLIFNIEALYLRDVSQVK